MSPDISIIVTIGPRKNPFLQKVLSTADCHLKIFEGQKMSAVFKMTSSMTRNFFTSENRKT